MRSSLVLLIILVVVNAHDTPLRRYSFAPPFQSSGLKGWILQGDNSKIETDYIRLTDTTHYTSSIFFNPIPFYEKEFEVSFDIKMHSEAEVGADGMAFWLTKGVLETGKTFGASGLLSQKI